MIMLRDVKDPHIRMASISAVTVSPDFRRATVMVSAVGTREERLGVVKALRHAQGYVRGTLADRLGNLKTVPFLEFKLDESIEYSVAISGMLAGLAQTSGAQDSSLEEAGSSSSESLAAVETEETQ